jgi:hypothetical protein
MNILDLIVVVGFVAACVGGWMLVGTGGTLFGAGVVLMVAGVVAARPPVFSAGRGS